MPSDEAEYDDLMPDTTWRSHFTQRIHWIFIPIVAFTGYAAIIYTGSAVHQTVLTIPLFTGPKMSKHVNANEWWFWLLLGVWFWILTAFFIKQFRKRSA